MLCSSSAGRLQEGGLTFLDLRLLTAQSRMKGPQTDSAIGKDPDAGRDWGQDEKGTTEDEMTG